VTLRRTRIALTAVAAGSAGLVIGALVSLSLQSSGVVPPPEGTTTTIRPGPADGQSAHFDVKTSPVATQTYLAWTPGGMPAGFGTAASRLGDIRQVVVVASDTTWMTRSLSSQGQVVDRPPSPFRIPIEAAAVDPHAFEPFLPQADRSVVAELSQGEGVLGASSAKLRGIGPGGVLEFGGVRIRIADVLPDELVGASELLVSRETGRRIGATTDRYALLQPKQRPRADALRHELETILPSDLPVQVRAPGETPYPRQGDAVLPPVQMKLLFGEFAARPDPGNPGFLQIDPAWVRKHIEERHLPLVGNIQCNVALFPQLIGAIHSLQRQGLSSLIQTEHGCYVPKFVLNDPTASISHHAWGAAVDLNLAGNEYGQPPHQDPRLVRVMRQCGFIWGGSFIIPDGNHFEYHRPPRSSC
jgi:D-alanyl-D-alanine carboxypeptidase-like protein